MIIKGMIQKRVQTVFLFYIMCFSVITGLSARENVFPLNRKPLNDSLNAYLEVYFQDETYIPLNDVVNLPFQSIPAYSNQVFNSYWVRITVQTDPGTEWIIRDPLFPSYYVIRAYKQAGNTLVALDPYPGSLPQRAFLLAPASEETVLYLRYEVSLFIMGLEILDRGTLLWNTSLYYLMYGLCLGIILIMIIYNVFLFFSFRKSSYLFFIGFLFFSGFFEIIYSGILSGYAGRLPFLLSLKTFFILFSFFIAFLLLFGRSFLCLDKYLPRLDRLLKYIIPVLIPLSIPVTLLSESSSILVKIMNAVFYLIISACTLTLYISSFLVLKKKYKPALYFIIPVSSIVLALLLVSMIAVSILPVSMTAWLLKIRVLDLAIMLMVILFALGLSNSIKLIRQEKERAQEEALASQELAIQSLNESSKLKDEFLANTSHELRTPLAGILGLVDTMLEGLAGPLSPDVQTALEMMSSSGRRLSNLINDLLDFSRIKKQKIHLEKQPLNLKAIVDHVFQVQKPLLENKHVECINAVEESISLVHGDLERVLQIFHNLIGNSVKFTTSGEIRVTAEDRQENVFIHIRDTGVGIPEAKLEEIFSPFKQADGSAARRFNGAGLGLSITRSLVELHGGRIWVEKTEQDRGTTFAFCLPRAPDQKTGKLQTRDILSTFINNSDFTGTETDDQLLTPPAGNNGAVILVIDDDPVIRRVLHTFLGARGWQVILAPGGKKALELIASGLVPDLVLLDLMMPVMTGFRVCQQIREQYDALQVPVIILTARNRISDYERAQEAGANDYLVKPFIKKELILKISGQLRLSRLIKEKIE